LHLGRVLEATVLNGTLQLGLQKEVLKPGGVDADVALLLLDTISFFSGLRVLLILVVQEFFFLRCEKD